MALFSNRITKTLIGLVGVLALIGAAPISSRQKPVTVGVSTLPFNEHYNVAETHGEPRALTSKDFPSDYGLVWISTDELAERLQHNRGKEEIRTLFTRRIHGPIRRPSTPPRPVTPPPPPPPPPNSPAKRIIYDAQKRGEQTDNNLFRRANSPSTASRPATPRPNPPRRNSAPGRIETSPPSRPRTPTSNSAPGSPSSDHHHVADGFHPNSSHPPPKDSNHPANNRPRTPSNQQHNNGIPSSPNQPTPPPAYPDQKKSPPPPPYKNSP